VVRDLSDHINTLLVILFFSGRRSSLSFLSMALAFVSFLFYLFVLLVISRPFCLM
jgi:membrane protein implicated in regulation of membrane protease activity